MVAPETDIFVYERTTAAPLPLLKLWRETRGVNGGKKTPRRQISKTKMGARKANDILINLMRNVSKRI
jgi:hypothetical protein